MKTMKKKFPYGGQAVIEGVMIRGPKIRAVAVRKPDQSIIIDTAPVTSIGDCLPFLKWPLIRGMVVLIESMVLGIKALTYSANQAFDEDEENLSTLELVVTLALGIGLSIVLLVIIPTTLTHWAAAAVKDPFLNNLIEGILRLGIFLAYIVLISRMKDIKRVFQYHGAEHKTIHAYEAGQPLTVEQVQRYSVLHPRCGTSFLLIVMTIKIFVYALLGHQEDVVWRNVSRILLLPVIAGISYEILKMSARHFQNRFWRVAITPGLWLQKLTTREPDNQQVEVAIAAFNAVLEKDKKDKKDEKDEKGEK